MKRILRAVLIVIVLLIAAVVAVSFLFDANQFRPALQTQLTQALGRAVTVGNLRLSLLSGGVAAEGVAVADDPSFSRDPFLKAQSVKVGVDLLALAASRKLNVESIAVENPEIALVQTRAGTWNFSSLGGKAAATSAAPPAPAQAAASSAPGLAVKLLQIHNGRVTIASAGSRAKPREFDSVEIELRDFSTTAQFPFTFSTKVAGGGEIRLEGKLGPIDSADTSLTPVEAKLRVTHFDLASSRLLGPGSGFGGLVSIDGTLTSNGQTANISGTVRGEALKLARNGSPSRRAVELDINVQHDLHQHSGVLSQADIHIGKALARLSGTYTTTEDSANLNLKLLGQGMPVPELAAMLPAVGVVLPSGSSLQGGVARADLTVNGPADRLVINGKVGFDNTTLAGFDLGSKMKLVADVAGLRLGRDTRIQKLSADVRSAPEGANIQDVVLIAPDVGELSGGGTISPADELDFRMQAKLHASGAAIVLGRSIPFLVRGNASSPKFEPDVKGMASQDLKGAGGLVKGLLGKKK